MSGVYLSYPFCTQKCTYCNFASGVFPRELEARYPAALIAELGAVDWSAIGWIPETVYLGGGTPSQIDPADLARILAAIPGRPWCEATIEAAPGGITRERAAAWRDAGINRVSLGVQSFVDGELRRTGRKHSAEVVQRELAVLRDAGIANFNLDLIAGLPGQTRATWDESLEWVERLEAPHVSVYMLEVDEDSRLGAEVLALGQRYGAPDVPGEDQIVEFYQTAVERLARAGIARYEISNFARPGFESRHNLKYWLREPYLGFGADAHSFDDERRWQNVASPQSYLERIATGSAQIEMTLSDPLAERFFLGLRLDRGLAGGWSPYEKQVHDLIAAGLLQFDGATLRLTDRGVLLSNEVFAEFVGVPI